MIILMEMEKSCLGKIVLFHDYFELFTCTMIKYLTLEMCINNYDIFNCMIFY